MNDIRPTRPSKSRSRPAPKQSASPVSNDTLTPADQLQDLLRQDTLSPSEESVAPFGTTNKRNPWKIFLVTVLSLLAIVAIAAISAYVWYQGQLSPVSTDRHAQHVRLTIESGSSPSAIASELEKRRLIRNALAFRLYTKLNGTENKLQAGVYNISPASSTPEIAQVLTSGKVDTVTITFLPGATLEQNRDVLREAGYKDEVITAAFEKKYNHPVFATKPASNDLEGYIYGETYQFDAAASVEDILTRTFDELYEVVKQENLIALYKKQNLSLFEGITLASIVQREIPDAIDQKKVAGVFFNRIKDGMNLGSDVTYQYIADKTGVPRDPSLDSPYNTRRYAGLPPGPIAAPGESALVAVAQPTVSDYLFFLSGDDDKTYFGRTETEHERNIVDHCQQKCQIL